MRGINHTIAHGQILLIWRGAQHAGHLISRKQQARHCAVVADSRLQHLAAVADGLLACTVQQARAARTDRLDRAADRHMVVIVWQRKAAQRFRGFLVWTDQHSVTCRTNGHSTSLCLEFNMYAVKLWVLFPTVNVCPRKVWKSVSHPIHEALHTCRTPAVRGLDDFRDLPRFFNRHSPGPRRLGGNCSNSAFFACRCLFNSSAGARNSRSISCRAKITMRKVCTALSSFIWAAF